MSARLTERDAEQLRDCLAGGGVAVFPSDTVYGLCCDPENRGAVARLYELKGRPPERASAVMFFTLQEAMRALPELEDAERSALHALLPGPVTALLANPARRFTPACGPQPETLGLRVPLLGEHLAALAHTGRPVMQSSANLSGAADTRTLQEVPQSIRAGAQLVLDGGVLPGTASTVLDLRDYAAERRWSVVREGALARTAVEELLGVPGHAPGGDPLLGGC